MRKPKAARSKSSNPAKRRRKMRRSKEIRGRARSAKIHQGVGLKQGAGSENRTLTEAAVKIGAALGTADRTAHKLAAAGSSKIQTLSKSFEGLKRQLKRSAKRFRRA